MSDKPEEEPKEGEETRIISTAILFMLFLLVVNELTLNQVSKIRKKFLILFKFVNNTMVTTLLGNYPSISIPQESALEGSLSYSRGPPSSRSSS